MGRPKGKLSIDPQDIVGKCFGKFIVIGYSGMKYDSTRGGERLRHWYTCIKDGVLVIVRRGRIMGGKEHNGYKDASQ